MGCWDDERHGIVRTMSRCRCRKLWLRTYLFCSVPAFFSCFVKSNLADKLKRKNMKWKEEGWGLMTRICLTQNNRRRRSGAYRDCFCCCLWKALFSLLLSLTRWLRECLLYSEFPSISFSFNPYLKQRLSDFNSLVIFFSLLIFFCVSLCAA